MRQLSAPQPGTQTLPTELYLCARHGGGQSQGLWGLQKPRRGCGRSRWPAPQMRGHFSTELRCSYTCQLNSGETPKKNLCTRDGRGERWGQRTRGMRGCSCAERACAWSRRACAEACPHAGAHSPPEKSLLRNSLTEELSVGSKTQGGGLLLKNSGNKSQSCWFGNLQGQPKSHQPFTSFEPETLPSSCVACTQCLGGRHTREQATQTQ